MFKKLYTDFVIFNKSSKYVGNGEKLYDVVRNKISENVTIITLQIIDDRDDNVSNFSFAVLTTLKKNFKIDLSDFPYDIQESDVMRAMP